MSEARVSSVGGRRRLGQVLSEMHCELRDAQETPSRVALAVWLGTVIGCLPLYGAHLILCLGLARLFRVSPVKTYLAAHVNNPLTAPWLLFLEFGIGRWLFTGRWPLLSVADFRSGGVWGLGRDLLAGSLVLGFLGGTVLALIAYRITLRRSPPSFLVKLRESACRRYIRSGVFHWEFVRGKLKYDPLYFGLLATGALPSTGRLLDLGCGRGILLALIRAAEELHRNGEWDAEWPSPPSRLELIGIEGRERLAGIARRALMDEAQVHTADIQDFELPSSAAILMLDVLHYLPSEIQGRIIRRAGEALEPGGTILIREPDPHRAGRFAFTRVGERVGALLRGSWRQRFHYRSVQEWCGLLEECGLQTTTVPMWAGTPHANVLIRACKPTT